MTTTPKVWRATQQANFTDAGVQQLPSVVDIGSGRYVAVWFEGAGGPIATQPGSDLVGQIFDAGGNRIGSEFRANFSFFNDNEQDAALDTRPSGGFVMVYDDFDAAGGSIRAQSYDVNGTLVGGAPTTIQADTNDDFVSDPTVAVRSDGSYLVAYERDVVSSSQWIVGRVVSASGTVGSEFVIGQQGLSNRFPDADVLSNGTYVVGFEEELLADPFTRQSDPHFTILSSTGTLAFGGSVPVDTSLNDQTDVHVAALTGGGLVVVWREANGDGNFDGIRARLYNNTATALGPAFTVNSTTAGIQFEPDVAALNDGGFVVVWKDVNLSVLRGQRFDATGHAVGVEFTAGSQGGEEFPAIAMLSDGRFVVGFEEFSDHDIWATIFDPRTVPFCDFDSDGKSGVLWRHDSGQVYFWEMNGLAIKAEGGVAHAPVPSDWHIQGAGDFDGDAKNDVLWRHDSGQVYFWEMDGLGIKAEGAAAHAPVPNDWHVQGIGDFDGDARSDILWRHDSGQVYFWEMDGLTIKAEGAPTHALVPNDWHIQGTGDFDGDGNSDILWRHDSGQVYIWEMNGLAIKAEGGVAHAAVPNDWHIQDIGDFNADGKSDILWRHDSGQVYFWEMNGLGIAAEGGVAHAPVPSDWHIFSPYNFV